MVEAESEMGDGCLPPTAYLAINYVNNSSIN